jgi:hypothetical protein
MNDSKGALADYNQAISINPKLASAYGARVTCGIQNLAIDLVAYLIYVKLPN